MQDWDAALETVVSILRTLAAHTRDVEGMEAAALRERYERWSRHLLFLLPAPGKEEESTPTARDWRGLRAFVEHQVALQAHETTRAITDLRSSLSVCADAMGQLVAEGKDKDALAEAQLESLLDLLDKGSPDQIRHAVVSTVTTVNLILEERQALLTTQVKLLSEQVRSLSREVEERDRPPETDSLTRLDTRKTFEEKLSRTPALMKMCQEHYSIVLVEIDDYAQFTNIVGEAVGQQLIKRVGRLLAQAFPRRGDVIARYEEHEYGLLLRDMTLEETRAKSEGLLQELKGISLEVGGKILRPTLSIGVAEMLSDDKPHRCLARADAALYRARLAGGNQVTVG